MLSASGGITPLKKIFVKTVSCIFCCMLIIVSTHATPPIQIAGPTETKMTNEINKRGALLRQDIANSYKILDRENAIKSMGNGRNDISSTVTKRIPVGSSFEEAIQTLRAAGFTIKSRGESKTLPGHYGLSAEIDEYRRTPFGKTTIYVWIEVVGNDDWSHVSDVSADILKQSL